MNLTVLRSTVMTAKALGGPIQTGGERPYPNLSDCHEAMVLMPVQQVEDLLEIVDQAADLVAVADQAVALTHMQAGALTRLQMLVRHMEERRCQG